MGALFSLHQEEASLLGAIEMSRSLSDIVYGIPCIDNKENSVCQLLAHMDPCNRLLRREGLQLREELEDNLGDVRLVFSPLMKIAYSHETKKEHSAVAIKLLVWLLTHHRCIVHVEVTSTLIKSEAFRQALRSSASIKRLHMYGVDDIPSDIVATFPNRIENLVLVASNNYTPLHRPSKIFGLNRCGAALTSLDVTRLPLTYSSAESLITLLKENSTVTNLAVGHSVFRLDSFTEYLAEGSASLEVLTLTSDCAFPERILTALSNVISAMTALQQLTLVADISHTEGVQFIADVIARNRSIRQMKVKRTPFAKEYYDLENHVEVMPPSLPDFKQNSVLEKLTLDSIGFADSDCRILIYALADVVSLAELKFLCLPSWVDLGELCCAVYECDIAHKVFIEEYELSPSNLSMFADYSEVKTVSIIQQNFPRQELLCTAITVLNNCSQITAVDLVLNQEILFDDSVCYDLISFVAEATNLRKLHLSSAIFSYEEREAIFPIAQSELITAIASNPNLRFVYLTCTMPTESDCQLLAIAALESTSLHHLTLQSHVESGERFLRYLAPAVATNYNLLRVNVAVSEKAERERNPVEEVTRRNDNLLTRAARFVLGEDVGYCARALEFMSEHLVLVETVQQASAFGKDEAKEMIKRALSSIVDLNDFMRAAGVIKRRVECYAGHNGQMQLDELDHYSWLHVRKYLKVADIVEPSFMLPWDKNEAGSS